MVMKTLPIEHRQTFEAYKSTICHLVKDMGDLPFIIDVLEKNEINNLYQRQWYPECFYLLAMLDYLSRLNHLPICLEYSEFRKMKLQEPVYPSGVLTLACAFKSEKPKEESYVATIPEFKQFNIIEAEVRNVV